MRKNMFTVLLMTAATALSACASRPDPAPYVDQYTESHPAIDAALTERFGERLRKLHVAEVNVDSTLSPEHTWGAVHTFQGRHHPDCRDLNEHHDNACYDEEIVARDPASRIVRVFTGDTPADALRLVIYRVGTDGRIEARLHADVMRRESLEEAVRAATEQVARQVWVLEREASRIASWEIKDRSANSVE